MIAFMSARPGAFTPFQVSQLKEVESYARYAVTHSKEDLDNTVRNYMQHTFTAIHPSVEWRFKKSAYEYMDILDSTGADPGPESTHNQIVFDGVYPLYHQSDIRNSSSLRNAAISADLAAHLAGARELLDKAFAIEPLPLLDELRYRAGQFSTRLESGLNVGDELGTIRFIREEIDPVIASLAQRHDALSKSQARYAARIDPYHSTIYEERRRYDESVHTLNSTLSSYVQKLQPEAQELFPHYFSLNATDGVDVTMYIGESMDNSGRFDPLYVRNLRLWEFAVLASTARLSAQLSPTLDIPLETAHLLVVQDLPITLQYDLSQKSFAVAGAYNIRYEIIKKRIDKAVIRGRTERLTQPGMIAVVYSQNSEAGSYRVFAEYLHHKGFLESEVEELELEDLQGVSGLRALRFKVSDSDAEAPTSMKALLAESL